jgi:hypothetical protein
MWKKLLTWFIAWVENTVWPWFKTDWMQAVNVFVIWIAFISTKGFLHFFIGAWFFIMVAYYGLWKLLGIGKLFKKVPPINPPVSAMKK